MAPIFQPSFPPKSELIIILPTDYLTWTEELEAELVYFQKQAKQDYSVERVKLLVSRQTSDRCSRELGISLAVNIDYSLPESK